MSAPRLTNVLMGAAATLSREVSSRLRDDPFAAGQTGAVGLLLILAAQEAGRTADTLITEQEALRAVFAEAALAPLPRPLRIRCGEASEGQAKSFRLEDLEAERDELMTLLIELHEAVEGSAFDWAERLEGRIWEILKLGAACRALYLPTL